MTVAEQAPTIVFGRTPCPRVYIADAHVRVLRVRMRIVRTVCLVMLLGHNTLGFYRLQTVRHDSEE